MFFAQGLSKLGSSPTRMGEILGCGLPVIANSGVGDVARIIERYRVGVLVSEGTQAAMRVALDELAVLQQDPELAQRCRTAAEEVFSLQSGTEAYQALYQKILDSSKSRHSQ
jgi:glycosyltransferase involved in cell wall biosynthesis